MNPIPNYRHETILINTATDKVVFRTVVGPFTVPVNGIASIEEFTDEQLAVYTSYTSKIIHVKRLLELLEDKDVNEGKHADELKATYQEEIELTLKIVSNLRKRLQLLGVTIKTPFSLES